MKTFKLQIEDLSSSCFEIEDKLPSFNSFSIANDEKQILRNELYRIRCKISALVRYAEMIDEHELLNESLV